MAVTTDGRSDTRDDVYTCFAAPFANSGSAFAYVYSNSVARDATSGPDQGNLEARVLRQVRENRAAWGSRAVTAAPNDTNRNTMFCKF